MKRIIAICCMVLLLALPAMSFAEPGLDPAGSAAVLVQEKAVVPLSLTALDDFSQVLTAVMQSNMEAAAKERVALALTELAKYQTEMKAKTTESIASKIFDISVKIISLAASIFAVVKITT